MSNEPDSWFKSAFGVDLGRAVDEIKDDLSAAVSTASRVVDKAKRAVADGAVGSSGSFPLGASVGRGGKNAAADVRAVQTALGLAADGDCGPKTIAAIKAYQKTLGQAKPDGRVDAGGATEKSLAGAGPAAAEAPVSAPGPARYHLEQAWPAPSAGSAIEPAPSAALSSAPPNGDFLGDLLQQQAALLQAQQNAGKSAEREHDREQIAIDLQGVNEEIASELWRVKAAEAEAEAASPTGQARMQAFRDMNPQLEPRYLTPEGNFTQKQLDAKRIQRGLKAARQGVAPAATLWATDDVGLAELVATATGALGALADPSTLPAGGSSKVPLPSAPVRSDPIGSDVGGGGSRGQGKAP